MMQGKYIVWIIATVIALMGGLAFFMQINTRNEVEPRIKNELILPYQELLKQGKFEEAYYQMTSPDYRTKYTLAQYIKAQDSNRSVFGNLVELKEVSGLYMKETIRGNRAVFKATYGYICQKASERIMIEAILVNGKFKLQNTYTSFVTIGSLQPVIY